MFLSNIFQSVRVLFSKEKALLNDLNKLLGEYPINLSLYKRAFTHKSALRMNDSRYKEHNERLEFLGDAVLSSIVADYLYSNFPHHKEGLLSKMRSQLVNRAALHKVAKQNKLEKYLVAQVNFQYEGKYIYSNMLEALIGAVYLDKGYKFTYRFVLDKLLADFLKEDLDIIEHDFKSRVLEWGHKKKHSIDFASEACQTCQSPESDQESSNILVFSARVFVNGEIKGTGTGSTKKEAEQNAARNLWESKHSKADTEAT